MLRYCVLSLLFILYYADTIAQHNTFLIEADGLIYTRPAKWSSIPNLKQKDGIPGPLSNMGYSIAYSYKNKYSLKFSYAFLMQIFLDGDFPKPPVDFIDQRDATFYDLLIGKSFANNLVPHVNVWLYAGVGRAYSAHQSSVTYVPGWWDMTSGESSRFATTRYYPSFQGMIKYNPLSWVFIGVGGTYRHLFNNFRPLSANLTVGFELGNRKNFSVQ